MKLIRTDNCSALTVCRDGCSTSYQPSAHVSHVRPKRSIKEHVTTYRACLRCMGSSAEGLRPTTSEPLPSTLFGRVVGSSVGYVKVDLFDPSTVLVDGKLKPGPPLPSSAFPNLPLVEPKPWMDIDSQTPRQLLCNLRSILKKLNKLVLVGDYVQVGSLDMANRRGTVVDLLPRTSEIKDPNVANVDHALLVFALHDPPFEELQVSRFLVSMEAFGLPFTLVLNKADLVSEEEVERRVSQVRSWGYEPFLVSCEQRWGLEEVGKVLQGRTSVVAGPSGAGKSSLINAIRTGRHKEGYVPASSLPPPSIFASIESREINNGVDKLTAVVDDEAQMESSFLAVGDVSKIGRGQHTTTTVSLIRLPKGGLLADTPGFSQPALAHIESHELPLLFPDFMQEIERSGPCRFANCKHLKEPGCVITGNSGVEATTESPSSALGGDEVDAASSYALESVSRVKPSARSSLPRYPHYLKMLTDIRRREEEDVKALQEARRRREGQGRTKHDKAGVRRVEARLESSVRTTRAADRSRKVMSNDE